jgi:hypothetical protein
MVLLPGRARKRAPLSTLLRTSTPIIFSERMHIMVLLLAPSCGAELPNSRAPPQAGGTRQETDFAMRNDTSASRRGANTRAVARAPALRCTA